MDQLMMNQLMRQPTDQVFALNLTTFSQQLQRELIRQTENVALKSWMTEKVEAGAREIFRSTLLEVSLGLHDVSFFRQALKDTPEAEWFEVFLNQFTPVYLSQAGSFAVEGFNQLSQVQHQLAVDEMKAGLLEELRRALGLRR